ncbi:hypothetical protein K1719_045120 [Acacia pycnantha]|nr:hypothetical protein K1719_045120 [Acacia pycnantha]
MKQHYTFLPEGNTWGRIDSLWDISIWIGDTTESHWKLQPIRLGGLRNLVGVVGSSVKRKRLNADMSISVG